MWSAITGQRMCHTSESTACDCHNMALHFVKMEQRDQAKLLLRKLIEVSTATCTVREFIRDVLEVESLQDMLATTISGVAGNGCELMELSHGHAIVYDVRCKNSITC